MKGNDEIGLELARQISHNDGRMGAVRAVGGGRILVAYDLSAAGRTGVKTDMFTILFAPRGPFTALPGEVIAGRILELVVIGLERLYVKIRVAIGTFHFLKIAVKFQSGTATGASVLQDGGHTLHLLTWKIDRA